MERGMNGQSTGNLGAVKPSYMLLQWWIRVIIHLRNSTDYNTKKRTLHKLWILVKTNQYLFSNFNKCTILMQAVTNRRTGCMGAEVYGN